MPSNLWKTDGTDNLSWKNRSKSIPAKEKKSGKPVDKLSAFSTRGTNQTKEQWHCKRRAIFMERKTMYGIGSKHRKGLPNLLSGTLPHSLEYAII